jgi:hypothetical protein
MVAHAWGVSGCVVERKTPRAPESQSLARFGSSPAASIGSTTSNVAESSPMTVRTGLDTREDSRYKLRNHPTETSSMGTRLEEPRGDFPLGCLEILS